MLDAKDSPLARAASDTQLFVAQLFVHRRSLQHIVTTAQTAASINSGPSDSKTGGINT